MESDGEYMHETQHSQVHTLDSQLGKAEANGNPFLETMFGITLCDQLRLTSSLMSQRKRGRPRKNQKSSSGARQPNGALGQQINGITLASHARAPSLTALKGVQQRIGGMLTYETLLETGAIPGRLQVR